VRPMCSESSVDTVHIPLNYASIPATLLERRMYHFPLFVPAEFLVCASRRSVRRRYESESTHCVASIVFSFDRGGLVSVKMRRSIWHGHMSLNVTIQVSLGYRGDGDTEIGCSKRHNKIHTTKGKAQINEGRNVAIGRYRASVSGQARGC
jgi:hypothetical protein